MDPLIRSFVAMAWVSCCFADDTCAEPPHANTGHMSMRKHVWKQSPAAKLLPHCNNVMHLHLIPGAAGW